MLSVIIILINWLGHVFICSVYKCYKLDDWWFLSVTGTLTGYSPCHNATEAGGRAALVTKAVRPASVTLQDNFLANTSSLLKK